MFGSCKIISGNAIFGKGKYFQVFGCISKNVLKNIFWCLVVFLKIPWKTHSLLVAHIFSATKQIYNIIHSSVQKHKQNPEKKYHQIRSNWEKKEEREVTGFGERQDRAAQCCDCDWHEGEIVIGAKARSRSVRCCDDQTWFKREREIEKARDWWRELNGMISPLRSKVRPLCLWVILSLSLSPFACLWAPLFTRLSSESDLKVK